MVGPAHLRMEGAGSTIEGAECCGYCMRAEPTDQRGALRFGEVEGSVIWLF